jgi:hypothetical protein
MLNRDEYVQKLTAHIDPWNAEAAHLFRRKSTEATAELDRLQRASADVFTELMRGADRAMQAMQEAFERARQNFDQK